MPKWVLFIGVAVLLLGGSGAWLLAHQEAPAAQFTTVPVVRQDLTATIAATGTLEPEEVVDLGAQVDGQIVTFGPDVNQPGKLVDYGSNVEQGEVLAKIDDRLYQFDLQNAKASLESGKSAVTKAEADLGQMQAKLFEATNDWHRAQQLGNNSGISQSEMDTYKANDLIAQANVADEQAAIAQAKTALLQYQASLLKAQQNVDYCTITSPVKGTIIDRRMNAGQTVVSSYSAPSLFLIAKDLRRMQVWAAVNEADVGSIHAGMPVTFTVDARPGQTFRGTVGKVRFNASMTQNVVTYTVEINTDNSDRQLLPYLTANVRFELDPRRNAQVVPNGALRWMPRDDEVAPAEPPRADVPTPSAPTPAATGTVSADSALRDHGTVWVMAGPGRVRAVRVAVGLSDGTVTEIAPLDGQPLADGTPIVTGELDPADAAAAGETSNPFVPQFGKRKH